MLSSNLVFALVGVPTAVFLLNVLALAWDAPPALRPFYWTTLAVQYARRFAGWLGDLVGAAYVAVADLASRLLERLGPALRQSLRELGQVLFAPAVMLYEFLSHLSTALWEAAYYAVSPYVVLWASIATLAAAGVYVAWRWRPEWFVPTPPPAAAVAAELTTTTAEPAARRRPGRPPPAAWGIEEATR
jgi:hypothetical protein